MSWFVQLYVHCHSWRRLYWIEGHRKNIIVSFSFQATEIRQNVNLSDPSEDLGARSEDLNVSQAVMPQIEKQTGWWAKPYQCVRRAWGKVADRLSF